jgi:hypothetical protein
MVELICIFVRLLMLIVDSIEFELTIEGWRFDGDGDQDQETPNPVAQSKHDSLLVVGRVVVAFCADTTVGTCATQCSHECL